MIKKLDDFYSLYPTNENDSPTLVANRRAITQDINLRSIDKRHLEPLTSYNAKFKHDNPLNKLKIIDNLEDFILTKYDEVIHIE